MKNLLKKNKCINFSYIIIFIYAALLYILFWRVPLLNIGVLGIPTQEFGYTDQNFYIYWSEVICNYNRVDADDFLVTWSSAGIVSYLTYSCRFFGSNEFFPILNIVFFTISLYTYAIVISKYSYELELSPIKILLLPYATYLIVLPGKELFSSLSVLFAIVALIANGKKNYLQVIIFLTISLTISLFNRPHEAALILYIIIFIILTINQKIILNIVSFIVIFSLVDYFAIEKLLPVLGFEISNLQDQFSYIGNYDSMILNENIFIHSLLFPIRVIVIFIGILFNSINNLLITENTGWYFIFRDLIILLRFFDITSFLIGLYFLNKIKDEYIKKIFYRFFIFYMFFIVLAGVDQKSRYIFSMFPPLVLLRIKLDK